MTGSERKGKRMQNKESLRLRECPFCGGKARMKHGYPSRQCKSLRQAVVQCEVCGCRTVTHKQLPYQSWKDVDRLAENAWNRRTTVETNMYDKEETFPNCTVQVLTNTATGETSVGWWRNGTA